MLVTLIQRHPLNGVRCRSLPSASSHVAVARSKMEWATTADCSASLRVSHKIRQAYHFRAIPVVRSFYRQKPRRQHLCIVERLLDFVVASGSEARFTLCYAPQFKLYTIHQKHQREVFIASSINRPTLNRLSFWRIVITNIGPQLSACWVVQLSRRNR